MGCGYTTNSKPSIVQHHHQQKMSLYQIRSPSKFSNTIALMAFLELDKSCVLKAEQFSGSKTAFVLDENGDIVAKQTIVKFSPTQAYCIYSECSERIAGKHIRVKEDKDIYSLRLISIETEQENRRHLPVFIQFHTVAEARPAEAHLVDRLAENVLGRFNLELKKNITHDSFVESDSWRDEAGFIVTDRNRFVYLTFNTKDLRSTLQSSNYNVEITRYCVDDFDTLCDFDNSVCGFSREEAIEFIASNSDVAVAKGNNGIDGMISYKGNKILALYAETLEIAQSLMKYCIEKNRLIEVSFFTREDIWECKPVSSRPVYRRHTRAIPSSIKWNKVYAINMGFHIV